jgi:hypothetical protein
MKRILFILALLCLEKTLHAQYVYTIKADSVKITNSCDTAELIIENHTQTVPGFLFNKGRGRTEFRRPLQRISDSIYLVGEDSLKLSSAWLHKGNAFGTTGIFGTRDNNHIDFITNNQQRGRWTSAGNLLLGTTTDDGNKLQVNGSVSLVNNSNAYLRSTRFPVLIGDDSGGGGIGFLFDGDATGRLIRIGGAHSNNFHKFQFQSAGQLGDSIANYNFTYNGNTAHALNIFNYADGNTKLLLTAPGNLLVGTTYDDGSRLQLVKNGTISINPNLSRPGDKIVFGGYINTNDGQNMLIGTYDGSNNYHPVLMERDGAIGIGWGSPQGWNVGRPPFRISAPGTVSIASQYFYFGNTGGPYNSSGLVTYVSNDNEWIYGPGYPNGQNYYYYGTTLQTPTGNNSRAPLRIGAKSLTFYTGASDNEAIKITDAQNVGIGTPTPSAQLHTTGTVRFAGLTNNNNLTRLIVSDANGNLYYKEDSSFGAFNGSINSDLAINGRVSAKQMLITQTGRWPDYVFSKQYQLPSLTEVESFIKKNNHLPGIPSAAEVEKNGIDVGNNQAAQLKKIEELTLYVIEQDKKLKQQSNEIAELKRANKNIEALQQQINELRSLINANK